MGEIAAKGRTDPQSRRGAGRRVPVPHQSDLYGWVQDQVALLRSGRVNEIDAANIAEELSDVGSEQYDKLESALEGLLMHMLKWDYQPERRTRGWVLTILEQRKRIERQLRRNPGLKPRVAEAVADGYETARLRAAGETGLDLDVFPETCPYTFEVIQGRPFTMGD